MSFPGNFSNEYNMHFKDKQGLSFQTSAVEIWERSSLISVNRLLFFEANLQMNRYISFSLVNLLVNGFNEYFLSFSHPATLCISLAIIRLLQYFDI